VLTVDYDRLGVRQGELLLDLGCGFGRHAYEAARRGAAVVALDAGWQEVEQVRGTFGAMVDTGELDAGATRMGSVQGNALTLPFASRSFDRVIASEVLEHIPDDVSAMRELARVLKPGGTMAVTVPRCGPETINWLLSADYHDVPGGHVRIYRRRVLEHRLRSVGLVPSGHHHAHALHTPYWWLRCIVGPDNTEHRAVAAYHRLLVWDIERHPPLTRGAERLLSPILGKSIVVYLAKPRSSGAGVPGDVVPETGGATPERAATGASGDDDNDSTTTGRRGAAA
jgi:SAM-dependent methyltransferase